VVLCAVTRAGFCVARIKSYLDYGTFTPIQIAAIAALKAAGLRSRIAEMYRKRRDVLCEGLNAPDGLLKNRKRRCLFGLGFGSLSSHGSLEFSKKLLLEAKVAVSPALVLANTETIMSDSV